MKQPTLDEHGGHPATVGEPVIVQSDGAWRLCTIRSVSNDGYVLTYSFGDSKPVSLDPNTIRFVLGHHLPKQLIEEFTGKPFPRTGALRAAIFERACELLIESEA